MRHVQRLLFIGLCTAATFFILSATAVPVGPITITGTVNSDNQIIADDGKAYTIAEREDRDELAQYEGEEVSVTGMVEVRGEENFISIISYEVVNGPEDEDEEVYEEDEDDDEDDEEEE
jgi:hypothetical protein